MAYARFASFILRRRILVLALLALACIVAGNYACHLEFESSLEIWFRETDPNLTTYREFLDLFQADETLAYGLFCDDVFSPDTLATIDRMSRVAEAIPFVHRVRSLATIKVFEAHDDTVGIVRLMEAPPATADEADAIRRRATSQPLLAGNLFSHDGKATAIVVEMEHAANTTGEKARVVEQLAALARAESRDGRRVLLVGSPIFDTAFLRYTKRDFLLLAPAALLLVMLVVFIVFRRLSAALVPLSVVLLATLLTFGLMGALDIRINALTASLVSLILAVGVADSVHLLADYYQRLMQGLTPDQAVAKSIEHLLVPCFFTSATTCAGMLSLRVSELAPVRQFGWLAAVGVGFAFLLSFTYIPAVLRLARAPDPAFVARQAVGPMSRLLERLGRPSLGWSRAVLVVGALLTVGSAVAVTHLETGANPMNYFKKDDPHRVETAEYDAKLGGSTSIEYVVHAADEGFKDPAKLRRLAAFQDWLEGRRGVARTFSVVDSLKDVNRVMNGGDPRFSLVPDSPALAAQYYLFMESEPDFESMLQPDYEVGRITARVDISDAGQLARNVPQLEAKIATDFPDDDLTVEATGFVRLMNRMGVYLLSSQRRSFAVAFTVITLMMMLLLRSLRLGLFSLIPNILPILLGLAFMALAGIDLDPGTVMIGGIALGLVVDDTVHFLVALRRQVRLTPTIDEAVATTMRATGRPIIVTSIVLAAGFSILCLGNFTPNISFGMVSAVVILTALVADLVMLPAALIVIRPRL